MPECHDLVTQELRKGQPQETRVSTVEFLGKEGQGHLVGTLPLSSGVTK